MIVKETASSTSLTKKLVSNKPSFRSDVLKLVSGTMVVQLLNILASPLLTRFYTPEEFGTFTLFTSITTIFGIIACLRYELAIMLPVSDEEAIKLLKASLFFAVLISFLSVPAVWWGRDALSYWLNAPDLATYLWLVPLAIFISGAFSSFSYWNTRAKQYAWLSTAQTIGAVTTTFIQLSCGFVGFATSGIMISSTLSGRVLTTIILSLSQRTQLSIQFFHSTKLNEIFPLLNRYRKFPLYDTWSVLLNSASWQLPAIMLSSLFSSTEVGYYALGFRVLQMPMSLIGSAISQVFFQRAAEAKIEGALSNLVKEAFRRLVMIGMFPMLMLAITGHNLFIVVFGQKWAEAGIYTQILAIWTLFWFISSPMSILINVLEKQEFGLKFNVVLLLTRLGSLFIGSYWGNARLALMLFAGTGALLYAYLSFALMLMAGVSLLKILGILYQGFLYFLPFGIILTVLIYIQLSNILLLVFATIFFGLYIAFLWSHQRDLFQFEY